VKQCSKCKEIKPAELFYKRKRTKNKLQTYCKICKNKIQAKYDASLHGRAKKLISTIHNSKRGKRASMEKTIIENDIFPILEAGYCQLTGLPFDFMPTNKTHKNPHAPSLDRIDSQKGYTKENCRVVLSAVNDALGENDDNDILPILKALVKGLEKHAKKNTATPVPIGSHIQGAVGAELGSVSAPWTWENSDDTDGHSRAVQGQDVDHSAQASSANGVGHGDK